MLEVGGSSGEDRVARRGSCEIGGGLEALKAPRLMRYPTIKLPADVGYINEAFHAPGVNRAEVRCDAAFSLGHRNALCIKPGPGPDVRGRSFSPYWPIVDLSVVAARQSILLALLRPSWTGEYQTRGEALSQLIEQCSKVESQGHFYEGPEIERRHDHGRNRLESWGKWFSHHAEHYEHYLCKHGSSGLTRAHGLIQGFESCLRATVDTKEPHFAELFSLLVRVRSEVDSFADRLLRAGIPK
jgi:hypothetical protein